MEKYISKLKTLFLSPTSFFQSVVKEKNYLQILLFFVVIYVIGEAIKVIFSIPHFLSTPGGIIAILTSVLALIFAAIFAFIIPFISAGITHLGVLIVGGKKGFFNTFKPVTYAAVIGILYGIISAVLLSIFNIFNPVDTSIFQSGQDFSLEDLPIFSIAVALLITLISIVHVVYAEVIGISKFQNISKGKAFLAIVVSILLVILVIVLIALTVGFGVFMFARGV